MRRAVLSLLLLLGGGLVVPEPPAQAEEWARKPRKRRPRRKKPRAKPRPPPTASESAENTLHQERLAVINRLAEVNADLKDAGLAASIDRLRRKEKERHSLARRLIRQEVAGKASP